MVAYRGKNIRSVVSFVQQLVGVIVCVVSKEANTVHSDFNYLAILLLLWATACEV